MATIAENIDHIKAATEEHAKRFRSQKTHTPSDYIIKVPQGEHKFFATNLMPSKARIAFGIFEDCFRHGRKDVAEYYEAKEAFQKDMGFDPMEIINAMGE